MRCPFAKSIVLKLSPNWYPYPSRESLSADSRIFLFFFSSSMALE
eukprot:CAMPEP_0114508818 /NCGR_PEP_ID=MMETSP0109-20121206/12837_1 /TAXON_ID=29199 /ORGANISM="Chlorarachnion reptans, Strain CCCM449" /LENGTH=44 /DNA_ID= /DNA_START= /DNA_END= /DNA_ORIENTATION=